MTSNGMAEEISNHRRHLRTGDVNYCSLKPARTGARHDVGDVKTSLERASLQLAWGPDGDLYVVDSRANTFLISTQMGLRA